MSGRSCLWALFLLATSCGLAEDERDEENKRIYLTISDPAFEAYCLEEFDADHNGRLSRYEAQRVRTLSCPGRQIASLAPIEEFVYLQQLDCSGNDLSSLDLRRCTLLQRLNCSANRLSALDVRELRALTRLDCSDNALPTLDLQSVPSLTWLDCRANALTTLDLASCARTMERVDARDCPLAVCYKASAQQIADFRLTDPNVVAER